MVTKWLAGLFPRWMQPQGVDVTTVFLLLNMALGPFPLGPFPFGTREKLVRQPHRGWRAASNTRARGQRGLSLPLPLEKAWELSLDVSYATSNLCSPPASLHVSPTL
jgi:hypothetical protein